MKEKHLTILSAIILVFVSFNAVSADDLRRDVEAGLRKSLDFYKQQQHGGGWASAYSMDLKQRWGEHLKVDKNVVTVNHSATTGVGLIFIKAAKVLNDPDLLVHARKAGDLLIAGQLPDGGFTEELRSTEAGVKPVGNQGVLEDHTTDRATELLLELFDATGDKKYLAAGRKAVDFLIKAQYPSGAFPQRYPINQQSLTGPYSRLYTINDGATSDPILRLISFYRRSGEQKYLDAAKRAGDWLISAVLPEPTPGWAEQYDLNNKPAKARSFEPPGTGAEATVLSIQALIELYLATDDKKYLGPVPKAVKWLESIRVGKEGKCFRLYDMKSGKAIFVDRKSGKIYHDVLEVPVPEQSRWYMGPYFKEPPAAAVSEIEIWRRLEEMGREKLLAQRLNRTGRHDIESGYIAFRTPEIVTEEDREALTRDVTRILKAQNAAGWWQGERYGVMTINSKVFTFNAIRLITWLEVNTDDC